MATTTEGQRQQATRAKESLAAQIGGLPQVAGIGLRRRHGDYVIAVRLRGSALGVPASVCGFRVVVERV